MIYLIGLLYKDTNSNTWILKQYFSNTMDKEKKLLEVFINDLLIFDKIITYNGDSFDLPFIDYRLDYYNINSSIDKSKSFDLYRVIRKNRQYLDLENLKLKTIEESLGFFRKDMYSGFDCIKFYYDYINSQNQLLKKNILRHNYDDLVHMLDVLSILDVIDDKKSFYINFEKTSIKFKLETIDISQDMIIISGNIKSPLKSNIQYYEPNYSLTTNNLKKFNLSLEVKEAYISEDTKCIYIDLLDFKDLYLKNSINYNLPENIYILMIENKYLIDNIINLLKNLLENIKFP